MRVGLLFRIALVYLTCGATIARAQAASSTRTGQATPVLVATGSHELELRVALTENVVSPGTLKPPPPDKVELVVDGNSIFSRSATGEESIRQTYRFDVSDLPRGRTHENAALRGPGFEVRLSSFSLPPDDGDPRSWILPVTLPAKASASLEDLRLVLGGTDSEDLSPIEVVERTALFSLNKAQALRPNSTIVLRYREGPQRRWQPEVTPESSLLSRWPLVAAFLLGVFCKSLTRLKSWPARFRMWLQRRRGGRTDQGKGSTPHQVTETTRSSDSTTKDVSRGGLGHGAGPGDRTGEATGDRSVVAEAHGLRKQGPLQDGPSPAVGPSASSAPDPDTLLSSFVENCWLNNLGDPDDIDRAVQSSGLELLGWYNLLDAVRAPSVGDVNLRFSRWGSSLGGYLFVGKRGSSTAKVEIAPVSTGYFPTPDTRAALEKLFEIVPKSSAWKSSFLRLEGPCELQAKGAGYELLRKGRIRVAQPTGLGQEAELVDPGTLRGESGRTGADGAARAHGVANIPGSGLSGDQSPHVEQLSGPMAERLVDRLITELVQAEGRITQKLQELLVGVENRVARTIADGLAGSLDLPSKEIRVAARSGVLEGSTPTEPPADQEISDSQDREPRPASATRAVRPPAPPGFESDSEPSSRSSGRLPSSRDEEHRRATATESQPLRGDEAISPPPRPEELSFTFDWLTEALAGPETLPPATAQPTDYVMALHSLHKRFAATKVGLPRLVQLLPAPDRDSVLTLHAVEAVKVGGDPGPRLKRHDQTLIDQDFVWQVLLAVPGAASDADNMTLAVFFAWSRIEKGAPLLAKLLLEPGGSGGYGQIVRCVAPAILHQIKGSNDFRVGRRMVVKAALPTEGRA